MRHHKQFTFKELSRGCRAATRRMRRHFRAGLPFIVFALLAIAGCKEDSPTGPDNPAVDLTTYFASDEAVVTEQGATANLRMVGVQFQTGSTNLTAESIPVLDKFDLIFRTYPQAKYTIEGHTDSRGSARYNQLLSERQAGAVRDYFVNELGGSAGAITATGHGETRPIDTNSTANGRAKNRRIEIIIER